MIDSGAQGNFINPKFVIRHQLSYQTKDHPYPLSTVDGSPATYGKGWVRIETGLNPLALGNHKEKINLDLMAMPGHDMILGIPWLKTHAPYIN